MRPIVPGRIVMAVRDTDKIDELGLTILSREKQVLVAQVEEGKETESCIALRGNPLVIFAEPSRAKHMRNVKWKS